MVAQSLSLASFPSSQFVERRSANRDPRISFEASRPAQVARSDASVVSEERWVVPQTSWRNKTDYVVEAQKLIKVSSGVPQLGDRTKRQIERAARATGVRYWHAFDLWYGKASAKAAELFVHRVKNNAASAAEALATARAQENTDARIELAALKARVAEIEARIAGVGGASPP